MKITRFATDAQHNAYHYKALKRKQKVRETLETAGGIIGITVVLSLLAQVVIGLN